MPRPAPQDGELPAAVRVVTRRERSLVITWSDSAESLVAWLHGQPVRDLAIGPPSLEELFLTYYRD